MCGANDFSVFRRLATVFITLGVMGFHHAERDEYGCGRMPRDRANITAAAIDVAADSVAC
jgi:hypothetical protein